ncbi:MAG: adenylyl-sulfate kinase [Actinomycetota bacterium]
MSATPTLPLSDLAVADLALFLSGIPLPWARLGGSLTDTPGPLIPPGRVDVMVNAVEAEAIIHAGEAILVDRETTPLAALTGASLVSRTDGELPTIRGLIAPMKTREAQLSANLTKTPTELNAEIGSGPRQVVFAGRPSLVGELSHDKTTVILVPLENSTPDGIPAQTLLRAVHAATRTDNSTAHIVGVPFAWRDAPSDDALATAIIAAYSTPESPEPLRLSSNDQWCEVLSWLDSDRIELLAGITPDVLQVLQQWRPPRNERGLVLLFTGFSGSGKSTVARDVAEYITTHTNRTLSLLDGDDVRRLLSAGLGFDRTARELNVTRIGYVATEIARHGGIAVCAPIAPYNTTRQAVRRMVEPVGDFVLIHVCTPLAECERRDLKGLYAKARVGQITEFTGISDPYDHPTDAALSIDTSALSRADALEVIVRYLTDGGWLNDPAEAPH